MPLDLPPPHPPELVARVMEIILASPYRTVHYTGGADEGLLRALLADRERIELSVMDMLDRWASGWSFFWEEGMAEPPPRPGWLEGVPFYQEGAPDHDIEIRDSPWDQPRQLGKLISFTGRQPAKLLILLALADTGVTHRAYTWERHDRFSVGRWREEFVSGRERWLKRQAAKQ